MRLTNALYIFTLCVVYVLDANCYADTRVAGAGDAAKHIAEDDTQANAPETLQNKKTSFEKAVAGELSKLKTEAGIWSAKPGHAEIDNQHNHTGKQCLHLYGGEKRTVEFEPELDGKPVAQLTFWAERWTRRSPFVFRIEQQSRGKWTEIYNGDKQVVIGGFRTNVRVDLPDKNITRIRFICTSPVKSGLLIDDVELIPPSPQRVTSVKVEPVILPALVGTSASPLLRMRVDVEGNEKPVSLTSLTATLEGSTNKHDLQSLHVYLTGNKNILSAGTNPDCFADAIQLGKAISPHDELVFSGRAQLKQGANYIWVAAKLKTAANIDHTMQVSCSAITTSDGKKHKPVKLSPVNPVRLGVALRKRGDDGIHTYRIPGIATTKKATLIGVYDVRRRRGGDLPGDIDVGMSRSTDGGRTWEPMRVILDTGDDPNWRYDGIGDPAILVDRNTGTIWVAGLWSHGNRGWFGSGPGLKPEETGQLILVRSDDDGRTWSKPINITSQVKHPDWCLLLQGPGKGITMQDGTLVFAAQYQDSLANKRIPRSTIIYSKDHGKTWQIGTGAFDDTTEAQVVESEPGVLMLNCRYNRASTRVIMTTRDMGKSWQVHPTSQRSLIEPRACMASLINVDQELGKDVGGWLLFSNPDSTSGRNHITIKASNDNGLTWPKSHRLLLDEGRSAGYSCMTMIDEETVGILYEGSLAHMSFQRIKLSDIIGNKQNVGPAHKSALKLPKVFGSHMVLQSDIDLPVWGTAKPKQKVSVSLGKEKHTVLSDENGDWVARFAPRPASTNPISLRVRSAGDEVYCKDILIGEVWVCAGQSNMQWPLSRSEKAKEEIKNANRPHIRLLNLTGSVPVNSGRYKEAHLPRLAHDKFCEGKWVVANHDSAESFSAVGWHFGRYLQDKLHLPIGLINLSVGGTPTESWMRCELLESDTSLNPLVKGNWLDNNSLGEFCRQRGIQNLLHSIQAGDSIPGDRLGPNHPFKPGFMWQAGVKPLIPFAMRGVIWYQGESNAESAARVKQHGKLFPLLIKDWRLKWKQGDFPFLYVQLPALNRAAWPQFRDSQRLILNTLDNVGMAITIDLGHPTNVHPTDKKPVGQRLGQWAIGTTYQSNKRTTYSGPLFQFSEVKGNSVVLHFDHIGDGLMSSDGKPLRHFEVAGPDKVFHSARARIRGTNVVLTNEAVNNLRHARYAWSPYPDPPVNFVNDIGLPASPFTTVPMK